MKQCIDTSVEKMTRGSKRFFVLLNVGSGLKLLILGLTGQQIRLAQQRLGATFGNAKIG